MFFRNYGLPKPLLDKYQKTKAAEYPWTSNLVKGPKQCLNLNSGTFTIFIDHCKGH